MQTGLARSCAAAGSWPRVWLWCGFAALTGAVAAGPALGQCAGCGAAQGARPSAADEGEGVAGAAADDDEDGAEAQGAARPTKRELERELRRIRAKHFGQMRNTEIRQIGIARLREFTDPVIFPSLLSELAREKEDVRTAVLDHLADQGTEHADATLAWGAIFDKEEWFRRAAAERLLRRSEELGAVPDRVRWVIAAGLKRERESEIAAAAELASALKLYEAIPMLINAQVAGRRSDTAGDGGSLAFILVGQQQAFVSDLTPVVGDSAVAFDPTLSVVTSGTVVRVMDAVVITYRIEVHNALVRLADAGWDGRSTRSLGWDGHAWREWYKREFVPYRERVEGK